MKYSMIQFKADVLRNIDFNLPPVFKGRIPFELTYSEYHDEFGNNIWYAEYGQVSLRATIAPAVGDIPEHAKFRVFVCNTPIISSEMGYGFWKAVVNLLVSEMKRP